MEPLSGSSSSHRPSHIVVFRRKSEKNAALVAEAIGGADSYASVAGHVELRSSQPTRATASVFPRLAVAAVDLNEEEASHLRHDPEVLTVVPNELYSLPPYKVETLPETGALSSVLVEPDELEDDPLTAFLHGLRTAADAALQYRSQVEPEPPESDTAAAKAHGWPLEMIGIPTGYSAATGRGIKVAVLDTGINRKHRDLKGRFQDPADVMSFVPGEPVDDGNGHGTHCAGVVAGAVRPRRGKRFGVAPEAQLLIGKVLNDAGQGYADQILRGIQWAADRGARIISMSIQIERGIGQQPSPAFEAVASTLLAEDPGVLLIGATGNYSRRPGLIAPVVDPAACRSIAAVAAVDRQRRIAGFSCGQSDALGEVDFNAPGVAVRSAWLGTGYRSISGTSMATPHVAGLAALWLERNSGWTAIDLWRGLEKSCVPPNTPGSDFGRGIPQAP